MRLGRTAQEVPNPWRWLALDRGGICRMDCCGAIEWDTWQTRAYAVEGVEAMRKWLRVEARTNARISGTAANFDESNCRYRNVVATQRLLLLAGSSTYLRPPTQ